jgi:uncharacterized cofD-like protein
MANGRIKQKKVVCIGGGTGTFVVLKGLKTYPYSISAIVTMSDSGGSNKRLRDEFGLLPTSDLRQCIVALADENNKHAGLLRQLFMYRFEKGQGISGMTFGNLFMAALADIVGSQKEAIRQTGKVLRINGSVIPVSYTDTNLFAEYENGITVSEEHLIDEPKHDGTMKITRVYLQPEAEGNPEALKAIKEADAIVLGPGDLYTSVLPNIIVNGIGEAIAASKAKKIYNLNLMTKYGQTYNFTASDHVKALASYIHITPDVIVVNNTTYNADVLEKYKDMKEFPVVDDLTQNRYNNVVRADVINDQVVARSSSDTLVRSLIRHDSEKLAKVLAEVIG